MLTRVECLPAAIDHTSLDKIDSAIGKHFGVQP